MILIRDTDFSHPLFKNEIEEKEEQKGRRVGNRNYTHTLGNFPEVLTDKPSLASVK